MDVEHLESLLTHATGALFVLLGVATWLLRYLVNVWVYRLRAAAGGQ